MMGCKICFKGVIWKIIPFTPSYLEHCIISYHPLTFQAQRLTQCPMGILTKAAPTLTEDNFIDIMPVAWELMLESDQELAAAAGM